MTDVHEIRFGYNLADVDRLAGIAVGAAWSQVCDPRDRYDAAWSAIAEALYVADDRPEPFDLKLVGMAAINDLGRAHRRHHGFDNRNRDNGFESAKRFLKYWELDRRGCYSPEPMIVERLALWQIWYHRLSDTDRRILLALVAHDGDQVAAARALGKGRSAYATALSTARHKFLGLWLEGETPQRRLYGKADIRRSSRYSATGLIGERRRQRLAREAAA